MELIMPIFKYISELAQITFYTITSPFLGFIFNISESIIYCIFSVLGSHSSKSNVLEKIHGNRKERFTFLLFWLKNSIATKFFQTKLFNP